MLEEWDSVINMKDPRVSYIDLNIFIETKQDNPKAPIDSINSLVIQPPPHVRGRPMQQT